MKKTTKKMTRIEALEYLESHGRLRSNAAYKEVNRARDALAVQRAREERTQQQAREAAAQQADEQEIARVIKEGPFLGEPKVRRGRIFGDPIADIDW